MVSAVRWLWIPLLLAGIAAIVWGVSLGQDAIVLAHAKTLCTACIGLG